MVGLGFSAHGGEGVAVSIWKLRAHTRKHAERVTLKVFVRLRMGCRDPYDQLMNLSITKIAQSRDRSLALLDYRLANIDYLAGSGCHAVGDLTIFAGWIIDHEASGFSGPLCKYLLFDVVPDRH